MMRRMFELPLSSERLEHCDYASKCMASDDPVHLARTQYSDLNTCEVPPMFSYTQKPVCTILPGSEDREKAAGSLWVRVLLGRLASERLPPQEESFGSEIQDWKQCAGDLVGSGEVRIWMSDIPCAIITGYYGGERYLQRGVCAAINAQLMLQLTIQWT